MTKTELQAKIAKMEKGLDNPNIQGAAREALQKSLKTAKEQLAGMSEPKILVVRPSHGKTERKKPVLKDVYVSIDKDSGDGKYDVNIVSMSKKDWEAQKEANKNNKPWSILKNKTVTFAGTYESLPKAIAAAKQYCKDNQLNPLNTIGLDEAPARKSAPKQKSTTASNTPAYSWKKKADLSKLQAVSINCQHYHLKIDQPTKVSLKRTGKTAMVVTAQSGDHIIFDHEGYAVYIMEAGSFAKKCTTAAVEQPVAKKATEAKPTTKKKATRKPKATTKKKSTPKAPSDYTKAIQSFDKEVDHIRTTYKKPEADQEQVKEDLKALAAKSDQKNYIAYVERKIKRLDKDGVRITKEEIIRIGIALRPLVQSVRGTLQDAQNTNRKVLEPTLDNLVRWAKSPGGYDLAGVDAAAGRKATAKAKVTAPEKKGFLEWLFD